MDEMMTDDVPMDTKPSLSPEPPTTQLKFEEVDSLTPKMERKPTPPNGMIAKAERETDSPGLAPLVVEKRESGRSEEQLPLIWDLREALAEAQETYITLEECTYQNKSLGASRQLEESMSCECQWDPEEPEEACGDNCINRLTQVECVSGECRCRHHCLNQRFQRKKYAQIDVVLTEKKGFGVRAAGKMPADAFVYEYIGEVIPHNTFARRIKEYGEVGIEHFYFMQLQKDEYIDATRKGNLGRFLNHSCRPNCYVAKWVVGKKMRMGIFTKRKIEAGEELTFNYNVDRYGHDAQECFCGEDNCVGWIGGKTQTDIGAMDDLYIDALGIGEEIDALGAKGSKKRKGRKLDLDFIPTLRPIELSEAPKVASAIRQATSIPRILTKLLQRVQMTQDPIVQRQLMRLHGISLMASVLTEYEADPTVTAPVIEILLGWPLITRNKLVNSHIEPLVERLTLSDNEAVTARAQELVKFWATLELGYRIPKAVQDALTDADAKGAKRSAADQTSEMLFAKRPRIDTEEAINASNRFEAAAATIVEDVKRELPAGWRMTRSGGGVPYYYNETTSQTSWVFPDAAVVAGFAAEWAAKQRAKAEAIDVSDILGRARQDEEEREAARVAEEAAQLQLKADRKAASLARAERKAEQKRKSKEKAEAKAAAKKAKEAARDPAKEKDKALVRVFGAVVVNTMSKWKRDFETDQFKRRAKEITQLLCDKERKSSSFEKETYASLSKDKQAKVRKFVEDYVQKLLARKSSSKGSPTKPSTSVPPTPVLPESPSKQADDEQAMVREMAGDGPENDAMSEDGASSGDEDAVMGETPDHDTPGSTPSTGKPILAVPPPPPVASLNGINGVVPPPPPPAESTMNGSS